MSDIIHAHSFGDDDGVELHPDEAASTSQGRRYDPYQSQGQQPTRQSSNRGQQWLLPTRRS